MTIDHKTDVTSPQQITEEVVARFGSTADPRLRQLCQSFVCHLNQWAIDNHLTLDEWMAGIRFVTAVGQACTATRQETILLSDTLGLSMVVDAINHPAVGGVTESTVLGPFYVPNSPERPLGASIVEQDGSGDPARVSGRVVDERGEPIAGAVLDVWQNADTGSYAVQDPGQPPTNLRGRFRTGTDGRYWFWSVRPTDYSIPADGPVGAMLEATGRHPWRPAHLHLIVSAPGHSTVTTHFFDDRSRYLDSDAVFGVKPSLITHYEEHGPGDPGGPGPVPHRWYSLERDVVLARSTQ